MEFCLAQNCEVQSCSLKYEVWFIATIKLLLLLFFAFPNYILNKLMFKSYHIMYYIIKVIFYMLWYNQLDALFFFIIFFLFLFPCVMWHTTNIFKYVTQFFKVKLYGQSLKINLKWLKFCYKVSTNLKEV